MELKLILIHGLVGSLGLTLSLLPIGFKNPRIMLQDYPKSIRKEVPPKTKTEKRQTFWFGLPFLIIFVGYPMLSSLYYATYKDWQFLEILYFTWGTLLVFNLFDLIVLDWLIFCTITPRIVVIPGTEGNVGYKNYKFHFVGFLKGIAITFVISIITSGITVLIAEA